MKHIIKSSIKTRLWTHTVKNITSVEIQEIHRMLLLLTIMDPWNERNKQIHKYNKVPDHIKILDKILSFKGDVRLILLYQAFYSMEEYTSLLLNLDNISR
jgi:hypothetical protein